MIVTSATSAPTCSVHEQCDELDIRGEAKLDNKAHSAERRPVDIKNMTETTKIGSLKPSHSKNICNFVNRVHWNPQERSKDWMRKHTKSAEQNNRMTKLTNRGKSVGQYIAYLAKGLSILSKFKHMCDGHLAQIKVDNRRIDLIQSEERTIYAAFIRDSYPKSHIDECIDSFGDVTTFSTLDVNSDYWQVGVAGEDCAKTELASHQGPFRFMRMPLGLKNTPERL